MEVKLQGSFLMVYSMSPNNLRRGDITLNPGGVESEGLPMGKA